MFLVKYLNDENYIESPHMVFKKDEKLESVIIINEEVCHCCFSECTSLKSVAIISDKPIIIQRHGFYQCSSLEKIIINGKLIVKDDKGQTIINNIQMNRHVITDYSGDDLQLIITNDRQTMVVNNLPLIIEDGKLKIKPRYHYRQLIIYNGQPVAKPPIDIHNDAFLDCSSLKYFDFQNVKFIGSSAFGDSGLESVKSRARTIEHYAFAGCDSLQSVKLNRIKVLDESLFSNCSSLTDININVPPLTFINKWVFSHCSSLKNIDLGNTSITSIRKLCFSNCYSLTNITLPNSLKRIPSSAFYRCYSLTKVVANNIRIIEKDAFVRCDSLINTNFPKPFALGDGNSFSEEDGEEDCRIAFVNSLMTNNEFH